VAQILNYDPTELACAKNVQVILLCLAQILNCDIGQASWESCKKVATKSCKNLGNLARLLQVL